jgi:hypothetical protein
LSGKPRSKNCEPSDRPFTGRTHEDVEHDRKDRQIITLDVVGRSGLSSGTSRRYLRRNSAKCVVSSRLQFGCSHTIFHRQADVLTPLVRASRWIVSSRAAAATAKQPLVRSLVSNKTLHQSGKGTAAVQTARARYSLIHPQERLWPFAKKVGRFLVYESLLSEQVQLWRADSHTCVSSVATTCRAAGTYGRPGSGAERQIITGSKTSLE